MKWICSTLLIFTFILASCGGAATTEVSATETPSASQTPAFTPTTEATPTPTVTPAPSYKISCRPFTVVVTGSSDVRPTGGSCTEIEAELTVYEVVFEVNDTPAIVVVFGANGEWLLMTDNVLSRTPSDDGTTMTVEISEVGNLDISLWITTAVEGVLQSQRAPEFTVTDELGETHSLSDYIGKVVVMYHWYTTCKYCAEDIPNLIAAANNHGDDVVFLLFDEKENETIARNYLLNLEDFGSNVLQITQKDSEINARQYSIFGTPTTIVIGPDGIVRYYAVGPIPPEVLEQYLAP